MKKFKKILIVIPIIVILLCLLCFPVSAASAIQEVTYSNCRFYDLDFKSLNSAGVSISNHDMSLLALGFYKQGSFYDYDGEGVGISLTSSSASDFGGNTTMYRTFIFKIDLPYSDDNQNFSMTLDLQGNSSQYISLGSNTFFKCGSKYATLTKLSNGNVTVSLENVSNSTIECQISFISTVAWRGMDIDFLNIYVRGTGTQQIIDNQNSNTDKEIQADKENTQAIIDNQNQLAEQEKQEVTDSGNDSVDGAMEIMPNYDLGDVFDGFVNVMHYDGLDAKLEIPEIYIPEISNVTKKVVLYKGGIINFKDYFDMIPNTIILVVRAFLTVALILFAFKELWTTIGQVLSGEGIKIMKNGLEGD